jgi:hypothetical protein
MKKNQRKATLELIGSLLTILICSCVTQTDHSKADELAANSVQSAEYETLDSQMCEESLQMSESTCAEMKALDGADTQVDSPAPGCRCKWDM